METVIAYFDESGDDGLQETSSETFVLSSLYMNTNDWLKNYEKLDALRRDLKEKYGLHKSEEFHTKHFLTDKNPYRDYRWTKEEKQQILIDIVKCISTLNAKSINVVIDKRNITSDQYDVLGNALTYNIQRIENDSSGKWNYIIITDKGRLAPMRSTARRIRKYNPIPSKFFSGEVTNAPIHNLIEDILEKDSKESYFIQVCDFISYIVNLYYKGNYMHESLPNRALNVIDLPFVGRIMATLDKEGLLNRQASYKEYGLVIYPKK